MAEGRGHPARSSPRQESPVQVVSTFVRVALIKLAVVVGVGVVTFLGPILKPFLVAVFLFFTTGAAARFLIRRRFPALLAYLTLFLVGSAVVDHVSASWFTARCYLCSREVATLPAANLALIGETPEEVNRPLGRTVQIGRQSEVFQHLFERGPPPRIC